MTAERWLRGEVVDLPEPWETPIRPAAALRFARRGRRGRPYTPRDWNDVPAGAADALRPLCDVDRVEQLFVVPASPRPINGRGWRQVVAPVQVLALGAHRVALWVETQPGGEIAGSIPNEDLAAVGRAQILLYGRLTFASRSTELRIRYQTVADQHLERALVVLRQSIADDRPPVHSEDRPELSHKWDVLARSSAVLVDPQAPVALLFSEVQQTGRRSRPRPVLVAVTPHELVVAMEPMTGARSVPAYGFDAVHVPRCRLETVCASGPTLDVCSAGLRLELPIGPALAERTQALLATDPCGAAATAAGRSWCVTGWCSALRPGLPRRLQQTSGCSQNPAMRLTFFSLVFI